MPTGDGPFVVPQCSAFVVHLDAANHVLWANDVEASRDVEICCYLDRKEAEVVILVVTVADGLAARFPATSIVAAGERPVGADELMVRIGLPLCWFTTTGQDDTGAILRLRRLRLDRGRQVHCERD